MKSQDEWMSISDMMSGLMLIFMFISISFMIQVQADKEKIENIAVAYFKDKKDLNIDLNREFKKDLKRWGAEITADNTVIFNSPNVLFESGKSTIKRDFKEILNDFFPRYINILFSDKYRDKIDEIRIEGHTSNSWKGSNSPNIIYLKNMQLSQNRANSVLSYCYSLNNTTINRAREWLETKLRANGMAFAKLKYRDINKSVVDEMKSRRVEFRVDLKTEDKIYKILKVSK
jgi:outer membrane protein OmpA-like peptidoglycan-associated protein